MHGTWKLAFPPSQPACPNNPLPRPQGVSPWSLPCPLSPTLMPIKDFCLNLHHHLSFHVGMSSESKTGSPPPLVSPAGRRSTLKAPCPHPGCPASLELCFLLQEFPSLPSLEVPPVRREEEESTNSGEERTGLRESSLLAQGSGLPSQGTGREGWLLLATSHRCPENRMKC